MVDNYNLLDIFKHIREHNKLFWDYCKDDYRTCSQCKCRNPLGDLECLYCGYIEVL